MTLAERLEAGIDYQGEDICWDWKGEPYKNGYSYISIGNRHRLVHRVVYEILVGPIPDGLTLDHLCRRRTCCNPRHLDPVPLGINILRGESPPADNARRDRCRRGHLYTPENTYHPPATPTWRQCRTCNRRRYAGTS